MFGKNKNFNPYNQFASKGSQQLYQDQYQQSESQPLVEQMDENYQPTEKQVRRYAIEDLGMSLPEDEDLLDIAREGIIAPLPLNWQVYRGKDDEVYYKHRITQQKTFYHPTDLQYRSKYEQMKEKAARKNLKSMNLKASNSNNNASNILASQMSNSNFMGGFNMMPLNIESAPIVKLDPKKQQEYQQQLQTQQERMKLDWKKFQLSERKDYQTREKKMRQEYEYQKNRKSSDNSKLKIEEKLQEQKEQIKRKMEQNYSGKVSDELKIYERQAENKTTQFTNIYQEDNRLKINKYQQEKNQEIADKERRLDQLSNKAKALRDKNKKDREKTFIKLKQQLQSGSNKEIEEATASALEEQLNSIKQEYSLKTKEKREELERQYNQTKRLLGYDQNSYLSELAIKKTRIKTISQQKMESIKNKQIQSLSSKFQNSLDEQRRTLKETLQSKYSLLLEEERNRLQQKTTKEKQKIDKQFEQKSSNQIANIYEELKLKIKGYQTEMNKKLSATQQKFITDIYDKSKGQSKDIVIRLQIKEKEMLLQSRNFMIDSLKRQMDLQKVTFQLLKLQSQVCKCSGEKEKDELLTRIAKKYQLQYRSDQFLKEESLYKQMRLQYKKDKQFLVSIMNSLEGNNRRGGVGGTALLKQYNQDVRTMRQNQQQLKKIENLLKKAQYNDRNAIEELTNSHFEYINIQLSKQMPSIGSERQHEVEVNQDRLHQSNVNSKSSNIELTLKQHSHFLTTMRHELNRKLYQIRSNIYY